MADRVLNTKIALLYKSYSQWDAIKSTYIPLKGEVCICEVPASTSAVAQEPCVLFKVGDGTKSFGELQWASALAADVYDWAKKANLVFDDLNAAFLEKLDERIALKSENVEYQMDGSNGVWKLQKREIGSETWTDVSTVDVASYVSPLLNKKVDKEIIGGNGKAEIFNESDGGGAHFIHNDGTESFVGVNDGGESGLMAQIYADKVIDGKWVGSRINIFHNGIYYVSKANQLAGYDKNAPSMEIATKKDIEDLGHALHFVGIAEKKEGETEIQAVERTFPAASQKAGAVAICGNKEFICYGDPLAWHEFGDVSAYATKAELQAEIDRATTAEAKKADLPDKCPDWLNPTGQTPYPWFMASLDVEKAGLGPDAKGNIKVDVGAYNFNQKQYYQWHKTLPFAATQSKSGLMVATDKEKLDNIATVDGDFLIINCNYED